VIFFWGVGVPRSLAQQGVRLNSDSSCESATFVRRESEVLLARGLYSTNNWWMSTANAWCAVNDVQIIEAAGEWRVTGADDVASRACGAAWRLRDSPAPGVRWK